MFVHVPCWRCRSEYVAQLCLVCFETAQAAAAWDPDLFLTIMQASPNREHQFLAYAADALLASFPRLAGLDFMDLTTFEFEVRHTNAGDATHVSRLDRMISRSFAIAQDALWMGTFTSSPPHVPTLDVALDARRLADVWSRGTGARLPRLAGLIGPKPSSTSGPGNARLSSVECCSASAPVKLTVEDAAGGAVHDWCNCVLSDGEGTDGGGRQSAG